MSRPRVVVAGRVGGDDLLNDLLLGGVLQILGAIEASVVVLADDADHVVRTFGVAAVPADVHSLAASTLQGADMVLLAGGRLISDDDGAASLTRHLAQIGLARAAGVPVLPYGIEIGDLSSRLARRVCRTVLPLLSPGIVRDDASVTRLLEHGGPECSVAPDPLFALQPPLVRSEDRIVVSLGTPPPEFDGFVDAVAEALTDLAVTTGLPLRFVSLRPGRDEHLHRRVMERITRTSTAQTVPPVSDALTEFGGAQLIVTMHHEGVVAAVLGGRPVVTIDDGRTTGVVDALGPQVARSVPAEIEGLADLTPTALAVLGRDADMIDVRDDTRSRLIRARSVIERTLYTNA